MEVENSSPSRGPLAYAGLLGWLGVDRLASERGITRGEFLDRALSFGSLPPRLAVAALESSTSAPL
jgi:hypothetical protein